MSQATQLLSSAMRLKRGERGVVLVDENTRIRELEKAFKLNSGLFAVSNRFDLTRGLEHWAKGRVRFSDFDLSGFKPVSMDLAGLRVGKEKAFTHMAINEASALLKPGGALVLAGFRTEGIKSYIEKAEAFLGAKAEVKTSASGARVGKIVKTVEGNEGLDDRGYRTWKDFEGATVGKFVSKPGIFGWSKEDEGSVFLLKHTGDLKGKTVLDLGCGYGFLAMAAVQRGASRVVATDNNATALLLCRRNLRDLETDCEVVASDAGRDIEEKFEVILCNPPFHQGKSEQRGLTRKFARNIGKSLVPSGVAYVVLNAFIPFAKEAGEFFSSVEEIAGNGSFRVFAARAKE